jgi:sporulation protein YlmC with PRC-barrel domain
MQLINNQQLKKVKVETKSGRFLGQIVDFEVDTDTGIINHYYVKSTTPIVGLFEGKLVINREQIIYFDDKKMVVEDSVVKVAEKEKAVPEMEKMEGVEPAITSKIGN